MTVYFDSQVLKREEEKDSMKLSMVVFRSSRNRHLARSLLRDIETNKTPTAKSMPSNVIVSLAIVMFVHLHSLEMKAKFRKCIENERIHACWERFHLFNLSCVFMAVIENVEP